jgi:hypothetical protein
MNIKQKKQRFRKYMNINRRKRKSYSKRNYFYSNTIFSKINEYNNDLDLSYNKYNNNNNFNI